MRIDDFGSARSLFRALSEDDPELAGDPSLPHVEDYALLRKIGEGGSGTVYHAVSRRSNHPLALKLFHRHSDRLAPEQAWAELALLKQLHFPFVPRVYDYGVSGGRPYIATDYVEGLSLEAHCTELDLRGRAVFLAALCDRVDQLHEYGLLHSDLKPSNVLVDVCQQPIVIDYGIAHLRSDPDRAELEPQVQGTLAYMSPEQAAGDPVTTRSDIYSLGATAFRILVGQPPRRLHGSVGDCLRQVAASEPPDAAAFDASFPRALARILQRAMARDPKERHARASLLGSDLLRWARGEPIGWTRPPLTEQVRFWLQRNLRLALSCGVAVVAVVAAIVLGAVAAAEARVADEQRLLANDRVEFAEQIERDMEVVRRLHEVADGAARAAISVGLNYAAEGHFVQAIQTMDILQRIESEARDPSLEKSFQGRRLDLHEEIGRELFATYASPELLRSALERHESLIAELKTQLPEPGDTDDGSGPRQGPAGSDQGPGV